MGANIFVFALSFINNKIIYLYLPEEENGIYFLIFRYSRLFALFFGDWMRLSNLNISGSDKSLIPVLSANGFWFITTVSAVSIVVISTGTDMLGNVFTHFPPLYIAAFCLAGSAFIARNHWQSLLLVQHRMVPYSLTFVVWAVIFLMLDIVLLVLLGLGISALMTAFFIATAVAALYAFFASWYYNGHSFRPSLKLLSRSAVIGKRAWVAILGMFLMVSIQAFTLEFFTDNKAEGLVMLAMFSVSFRVFNLLQRVSDAAGTVLYSYVVQRDSESAAALSLQVTRNIFAFTVISSIAVALLGKQIIYIIASSDYLPAYLSLLFMLPGICAVTAGSVLNNYFWGRDYPLPIIVAPYAATVLGAILNAYLIPRYSVNGATLSFSIMMLVWFAYIVVYFSRKTGYKMKDILIPHISDYRMLISRVQARLRSRTA